MMNDDMVQKKQEDDQEPSFSLEKIYCKDLSLEMPHAPEVFLLLGDEPPELDMQLSNQVQELGDGFYESSIKATLTSKLKDDKVLFLIELTQAGIFQMRHIPEEHFALLTQITCPNILFPYLRETVSGVASRAGFSNVMLSHINFEQLYAQKQASEQDEAQSSESSVLA